MQRDIVIFGAGGYARCVAEAADLLPDWRVTAFVASGEKATSILDRPVIDEERWFARIQPPFVGVVAIGDNWVRQQVVERIRLAQADFEFCRIVHPGAFVAASAQIGSGSVVLAGSVINSSARIGEHVSIYTNAVVEHDDALADFVSLAPGATLGGAVSVGTRSFIGLGASVIHNLAIGADVVIGAGATVIDNCADRVVATGLPARVTRHRTPGDRYL